MPAEEQWFARSPSLAAWIALGALATLIAVDFAVIRRRGSSRDDDVEPLWLERVRQLAPAVALAPALATIFFEHTTLSLMWWFLAAVPFAMVLQLIGGMIVGVIVHWREVLRVERHQRAGTAIAVALVLFLVLCIPLGFVALHQQAQWDAHTSLAGSMSAAFLAALLVLALMRAGRQDHTRGSSTSA